MGTPHSTTILTVHSDNSADDREERALLAILDASNQVYEVNCHNLNHKNHEDSVRNCVQLQLRETVILGIREQVKFLLAMEEGESAVKKRFCYESDEKLDEHFDWYFKCVRPSSNYLINWLYMVDEDDMDKDRLEAKTEEFREMCHHLAHELSIEEPFLGGREASIIDIVYYCDWTMTRKLLGAKRHWAPIEYPWKLNVWAEKMLEEFPTLEV